MKITQPSPSETENQFDIKFHEFNDNYDLAEEDPEKAKELFFIEINNKKKIITYIKMILLKHKS